MLTMCETGAAIGVSLQPLLKPEQRKTVKMLHQLGDWRLTLYRKPVASPQMEAAVEFLTASVLNNPAYPDFAEN